MKIKVIKKGTSRENRAISAPGGSTTGRTPRSRCDRVVYQGAVDKIKCEVDREDQGHQNGYHSGKTEQFLPLVDRRLEEHLEVARSGRSFWRE